MNCFPKIIQLLSFQDYLKWPIAEKITANFVYLRFYKKTNLFFPVILRKEWAGKIKNWQKKGLDVYVYFNNDALGYAVENAEKLISNVKCQISKPNLKSKI